MLKTKVLASESSYQSKSVPIPLDIIAPIVGADATTSITFMGRLANEILSITSPRNVIYVPARSAWYDYKTTGKKQVLRHTRNV